MPVFALHTVLFPGQTIALRVFEERYLRMMEDVLPAGRFVVVAIRRGQEVAGGYEAHRVGVTAALADYSYDAEDGTYQLEVVARERVALMELVRAAPYPTWRVEPFPDEGGAGTDDLETARAAFGRFLTATGADRSRAVLPHEPVSASYALAAAVPALVPDRQALLELPGAGARLQKVTETLRLETGLLRALHAGVGGASLDVSPN